MSAIGALREAKTFDEKTTEAIGASGIEDTADHSVDTSPPKTSEEMLAEFKEGFRAEN